MPPDLDSEGMEQSPTGRETVVQHYRRYSVFLIFTILAVLLMFSTVILWQNHNYEKYDIQRLGKHFDEYVSNVDNVFNDLWYEMVDLQTTGGASLFESRHATVPMPYAFRFLEDDPDKEVFHLDNIGAPLKTEDMGNLTGDGTINGRSPEFYREVAMALKLMVQFDTLANSIPNLVWAYYYSRDNFAVYYPWVRSTEVRFEKESYNLTAWSWGLPENNPQRTPYWTETYFDSVGKGLMVSCLAPVYDGDRFVGVVGSDLSVDYLNEMVAKFEPEREGTFLLYDQYDKFLAHPRLIAASDSDITSLEKGLPEELRPETDKIKSLQPGLVTRLQDWRVLRQPLKKAPYVALYMEPVSSWFEVFVQRIGFGASALTFIFVLLLVVSLVVTHRGFVGPSAKFVQHILLKSRDSDSGMEERVPASWKPWFSEITRVFNENADLTRNLKEKNVELQEQIIERQSAQKSLQDFNRSLELRVARRTEELSKTNREIEEFVYSISHDLRAPLRSIGGFAEIIDRRYKQDLNEEGQRYFANIIEASAQMSQLIDALLAFSRLGSQSVDFEKVALGDAFDAAVNTLSDHIKETGAVISLPEELPDVWASLSLLHHLLVNILENALKYRKPDVPPAIKVSVETLGTSRVLSIADNGIGIDPEYHEKVFNIFQRLHSQEEYPGTGIGLATVKKVAHLVGGRAWVESQPEGGSVFKVEFPVAPPEE